MSYTRPIYDECDHRTQIRDNVSQVSYIMDPLKYDHCSKCRHQLGLVGATAVSHINGNLVDLENNLRGQTYPVTNCPEYKYSPEDTPLRGKEYIKPVCHPRIDTSVSHLPECQMFRLPAVLEEPPMEPYSCTAYARASE